MSWCLLDDIDFDFYDRFWLELLLEKAWDNDNGLLAMFRYLFGIETIAAALSEDIGTVEEVLEPYLMQIGFLKRTPRGRMVTPRALHHLGKTLTSARP